MTTDEQLSNQVHDAYESVGLSDEAQDRILAELLSAQAGQTEKTKVLQGGATARGSAPRARKAWVLLPVAAALLAVFVMARLAPDASLGASAAPDAAAPAQSDEAAAYDSALEENATAESAGAEDAIALGTVDYYPIVQLEDGTTLSALIDARYTEQVDATAVGESLGAAQAHPTDAENTVACEVYRLTDGSQGYAVRYEEEQTYWRCLPMD